MDEFRVGSISQYEPYREDQPARRTGERKDRRSKAPAPREDGFDSSEDGSDSSEGGFESPEDGSESSADGFESSKKQADAAAGGEPEPQDYYTPSEPEEG